MQALDILGLRDAGDVEVLSEDEISICRQLALRRLVEAALAVCGCIQESHSNDISGISTDR